MDEQRAWESESKAWVERVRETETHPHDAAIRELLPPPSGPALDVGCGEGRLTRLLGSLGYDVTGVDRSATLVEEARRADPGGRYAVASIDALPFGDESAALALCVNVLPHVEDIDRALRELARVLRPGGTLVVGTAHPVMLAGTLDEATGTLAISRYFDAEPQAVELGHAHVHHQRRTIEQYVRAFRGAGFALEDLREIAAPGTSVPRYLDMRLTRG